MLRIFFPSRKQLKSTKKFCPRKVPKKLNDKIHIQYRDILKIKKNENIITMKNLFHYTLPSHKQFR